MRIFRNVMGEPSAEIGSIGRFSDWSIRKKLLMALIPVVVGLLAITGYATHLIFRHYFGIALERNVIVQTLAQAHAIEGLYAGARDELAILASGEVSREALRDFLETRAKLPGRRYVEIAFVGVDPAEQVYYVLRGDAAVEPPREVAGLISGGALAPTRKAWDGVPGRVAFGDLTEVVFPPSFRPLDGSSTSLAVFRLSATVLGSNGTARGYLVLSIDARAVRNILSLYNSPRSPLHGFSRAAENRMGLYLDDRGWMLFQSENVEETETEPSIGAARSNTPGDLGRPGFGDAFRPASGIEVFWRMVAGIQSGKSGLERGAPEFGPAKAASSDDFLGYAPIWYAAGQDAEPVVVGGIIQIDRTLLPRAAEFGQLNLMFAMTLGSGFFMTLLIYFLSRTVTRPIHRLTDAVRRMRLEGRPFAIAIGKSDLETSTLAEAINELTASLAFKEQELKRRDAHIRSVRSRERVRLVVPRDTGEPDGLAALVGQAGAMAAMKAMIRKAAASDADVLIVGETGTGKELAAEAVHKLSARSEGPFVSINCGALDENLLMDALFGHVKGAFSEARSDRKGAFLAADGGTLHLDEIGNATMKVQQSLLRALSVRKIRPLGTDQELMFDVRVLAATNVNLLEKVQAGEFREDLYYRLQVLTITTPPLRERSGDIALLADHFLSQAAERSGRVGLGLSRGALDRLLSHDWPGNVRELKNCITRAAALAEDDLILAGDIHFGESGMSEPRAEVAVERHGGLDGNEGEHESEHDARLEAASPKQGVALRGSRRLGPGSADILELEGRDGRDRGHGHAGRIDPADRIEPDGRVARDGREEAPRSGASHPGPLWPERREAGRPAGMAEPTGMRGLQRAPVVQGGPESGDMGINDRQRAALRLLLERRIISRKDYQDAQARPMPARTAQLDLQGLVARGLVKRIGQGPATRYALIDWRAAEREAEREALGAGER